MKTLILVSALVLALLSCSHGHGRNLTALNEDALKILIKEYSDSINLVKQTGVVPLFLSDPQFDYTHQGMLSPNHFPLPLRYMIIERARSCESLKVIIDKKIPAHKVQPIMQNGIPVKYLELSSYQLMTTRFNELKCGEKRY